MESKDIPEDLRRLEDKIGKLKNQSADKSKKSSEYSTAGGIGIRMAADLLAGVIVGAGIGYVLDYVFDTRPVLLAIFLLFGGAAGFLNIYRSAHDMENKK